MTMEKKQNKAKVIPFPIRNLEEDPEKLLRFTVENQDEFFIKAKYRKTIRELTKSMLSHFSGLK